MSEKHDPSYGREQMLLVFSVALSLSAWAGDVLNLQPRQRMPFPSSIRRAPHLGHGGQFGHSTTAGRSGLFFDTLAFFRRSASAGVIPHEAQ